MSARSAASDCYGASAACAAWDHLSAAEKLRRLDATDPSPSFAEMARRVGCAVPVSAPGDRFERGWVDIAMYWPDVLT